MNYSDFKLHGISPIYDQVVVVRCHLCKLIIKLPHLVEHLQKRHKITNDSNETDEALSELILTEKRLCTALNEEKNLLLAGGKSGKKAGRTKQQPSESNGDGQPIKSGAKSRKSKTTGPKSKIDKNELKKELPTIAAASNTNANMPLLSSILDDSLSSLKTSIGLINCPNNESPTNTAESQQAQYPAMTMTKNGFTVENHHNHHQTSNNHTMESSTDPSNDQIRFKYVVEKIKTKIKGSTSSPSSSPMKGPADVQFSNSSGTDNTAFSFPPNKFAASQQQIPASDIKSQEILKNELITMELNSPNKYQQVAKKSKYNIQQATKDEKTSFNMLDDAINPMLSQQLQQQQNNHLYNNQSSIIPNPGIPQQSSNPCHDSMVLNQFMNKSSPSDNNNHFHHDSINKLADSHQYDSPFKHDSFDSMSYGQDNGEKIGLLKSENNNLSNCIKNNNDSINLAIKTSKTYDPNKHCGVVVEEVDSLNGTKIIREPCTRSLTCKKHSINLRRQVGGRCKSFNELFKEYRDEKLSTNHLVNSASKSSCDISINSAPSPMKPNTPNSTVNCSMNTDSSRRSSLTHAPFPNVEMGFNSTATSAIHPQDLVPDLNNQMNTQANHLNHNNNGHNMNINNHHLMSDMNKPMNGYDFNSYQNIPLSTNSQYNHPHHQQQQQQLGQDYYMNNIPHNYQIQHQQQNQGQPQYSMMHKPHQQQQQQRNDTNTTMLTNTSPSVYKPYLAGSPTQNPKNSSKNYNFLSSPCPSSNPPSQQQQRPLHFDEINQQLNLNYMNKMLVKHHPRPSAVTSYNARLTDNGGGYTLWDRKQDNLRLLLSNAFNQTDNFLNKNLSFTSGMNKNSEANAAPPNLNYNNDNSQTTSSEHINKKVNKQDMKQKKRAKSCYNETAPVKNEPSNFNNSSHFNHQNKALTKIKNSTATSNSKKRSIPTGDVYQSHQQNLKQSNYTNGNRSSSNINDKSHPEISPNKTMVASIDNLAHHNTPAKMSKPSIDLTSHDVDYRTEVTGFTTNNDVDYRTELTGFTTNNDVDYRTELTGFATNQNSIDASKQPSHWNQLPYPNINNQMLLNGNLNATLKF